MLGGLLEVIMILTNINRGWKIELSLLCSSTIDGPEKSGLNYIFIGTTSGVRFLNC